MDPTKIYREPTAEEQEFFDALSKSTQSSLDSKIQDLQERLATAERIIERMKIRNESRKFLYQCIKTHNKKQAQYIAELEDKVSNPTPPPDRPDAGEIEGMVEKYKDQIADEGIIYMEHIDRLKQILRDMLKERGAKV